MHDEPNRNLSSVQTPSLIESLQTILKIAKEQEFIKIKTIFSLLAGKGYAALLIIFSLPFCLPINIPGFSTPFGIILAFIGFRIAFGKHYWLPKWILEKSISTDKFEKVIGKILGIVQAIQKILRPRLVIFIQHPFFHVLNGLLITFLAILLSIPFPIPLTNMLCALPILCFALGLLEDDGCAILVGYFFTFLCFGFFILLFFVGKSIFV